MLLNALIYLCAAVLSVPIAKRLGLGSVLGYLIAGVLIGPYVLHLVGDQTDVMHFAELGVVMMLFLVGLELHPNRLWAMRRPILGVGGLQVVITASLISLVLMLVTSWSWQITLTVGLALALSSTAIVLQSLNERGLTKTPAGTNAFAVLLFQDIAIIPILALLPLLAVNVATSVGDEHSASLIGHLAMWQQVVISIATIGVIILSGKFLSNPIFRFIAETRLGELFTAFALLIIVAIALLMQAIGLSPALGSFLAGVVLAESEFRHELEVDIEPFKGLLLGLFFITVGASIDFQLLFAAPIIIMLAVLGLIIIKAIVLYVLAISFGLGKSQGLLFALALAQGGEFAFVMISAAKQFAVLDTEIGNLITVIVALSMLISPLLLVVYEAFFSRVHQKSEQQGHHDEGEIEKGQAIIVGFGRFGQIIGRLLTSQGYELTILDHTPGQVELLRSFGHKVYYGDAARRSLLEAAGAGEARLLVMAIDDADHSISIIDMVQKNFPDIQILARAVSRSHASDLRERKIADFRRDVFDSALNLGVKALRILGQTHDQAERAGNLFKAHDRKVMLQLTKHWGDDHQFGIAMKQGLDDLRIVLESDMEANKKEAATKESSIKEEVGDSK
ncbi:MAG: potassium transporter [Alteromonadaceae bacterium]|nr:MAG: potassium transporter [Alteromonadaceae bacterium]